MTALAALLWFFLLGSAGAQEAGLPAPRQEGPSHGGILTNAREGSFPANQRFWFSLDPAAGAGRFRLLLDGREIYRGAGPAQAEIAASPGEERRFILSVERYGLPPENRLEETLSWEVRIDRKAPAPPRPVFRWDVGGALILGSAAEEGVKISAYGDYNGTLFYLDDTKAPSALSMTLTGESPFYALLWTVDGASNFSDPVPAVFEAPPVAVVNPVPGNWRNPQTLVISGGEGRDIYWTSNGTNPLEGGRRYHSPVRIENTGEVVLRIAWRGKDGQVREDRVAYSAGGGELGALGEAEEKKITGPLVLKVPEPYLWAMGGEAPQNPGGTDLTLRVPGNVKRNVVLHAGEDSAAGGFYRFVYTLDGTGEESPPQGDQEEAPPPAGEGVWEFDNKGIEALPGELRYVYAGKCRALLWPRPGNGEGPPEAVNVRYSWDGEEWKSGRGPLPVPPQGGILRWIIDGGEGVLGPFRAVIPRTEEGPVIKAGEAAGERRGRLALRPAGEGAVFTHVSPLLDFSLVPGAPESCDGEDLEWAFIAENGAVLQTWRSDRLAPGRPLLDAPAEGSWNRGPLKISAPAGGDAKSLLFAEIKYESGTVETLRGEGSLLLAPAWEEYADITLEVYLEDAAGNRGPRERRNFILDPRGVYAAPGFPLGPEPTGGADRPFHSLEEALTFARRENREEIKIAGPIELTETLRVEGNLSLAGTGEDSGIFFAPGAFIEVTGGASLSLRALKLERPGGEAPLLKILQRASLEASGLNIAHGGKLLYLEEGARGVVRDTKVSSLMTANVEEADIENRGTLFIGESRFELEGVFSLLLSQQGGDFSAENSGFTVRGQRTAAVLRLAGARGDLNKVAISAAAADYAAGMEISASGVIMNGGVLSASARDGIGILTDNSRTLCLGAAFSLKAAFIAAAMEIRGPFPLVADCRFDFLGNAKRSDVFSSDGRNPEEPEPGSIGGNNFGAFSHLMGENWPRENIRGFNRRYAPPERPNGIGE
ncbi:MAG: hypothetical protein LBL43_07155 [Treponema sp.]|jgi:hypothetical protein|nr:hypothetical protein [Treponema sp.]